eukprot:3899106-Pyramimonas_sp.AAC.3
MEGAPVSMNPPPVSMNPTPVSMNPLPVSINPPPVSMNPVHPDLAKSIRHKGSRESRSSARARHSTL